MLRATRTLACARMTLSGAGAGGLASLGTFFCATSAVLVAASSLAGCGGVYYAAEMSGASSKVEEARVLGAETTAPYEYYYAREHLVQAELEAAEASYSDAAHYAETAEEYAQKAVDVARSARRNAGPQ